MERKFTKKSSKFSLLLIKLAVCCGILASPSIQAFILPRTPEGSQLLPPNPYEYNTFQNDSELKIKRPGLNKNTSKSTLILTHYKP